MLGSAMYRLLPEIIDCVVVFGSLANSSSADSGTASIMSTAPVL